MTTQSAAVRANDAEQRSGAPHASGSVVAAPTRTGAADDPISASPDAVWYVRPPSGGQYGPAGGDLMRRWLDEGRVAPEALVWREGWGDWQLAADVFPRPGTESAQPVVTDEDLPLAGGSSGVSAAPEFPKDAPVPRRKRIAKPSQRGRNVAIIVVLSVLCLALLAALVFVLYQQT